MNERKIYELESKCRKLETQLKMALEAIEALNEPTNSWESRVFIVRFVKDHIAFLDKLYT